MPPANAKPVAAAPIRSADQLPWIQKGAYGVAACNPYFGGQFIKVLSNSIFVAGLSMSPAGLGIVFLIFRLWDGMVDPVIGWMSDNTRTRWGRRRPYMLVAAIASGLIFPFFWFAQPDWSETQKFAWLLGVGFVFYLAISLWAVPYTSMLPDLTPDTHERTSIISVQSVIGHVSALFGTWVWSLTQLEIFHDPATGQPNVLRGMWFIGIGVGLVMIVTGLLPVFFVRERDSRGTLPTEKDGALRQAMGEKISFWRTIKLTAANPSFRTLCLFTVIFTFGINAVQVQTFYLRVYYSLGGDLGFAARLTGIEGTGSMIVGLASIPLFQYLSRRYGKKQTLVISSGLMMVATLSSWFTYTPDYPWLAVTTGILLSPAYTGLFMVLPSMAADVVDDEEARSGARMAGSFSSVFSWTLKVSQSLGYGLAGMVVVWCGFDAAKQAAQSPETFRNLRVCFALAPTVVLVCALVVIVKYPLSQAYMQRVRAQLDGRRSV